MFKGLIRDRIVCGITNDQIRGRLLREPNLTLQRAVNICHASEGSQNQLKSLQEETEIPMHKIHKQKNEKKEIECVQPKKDMSLVECTKCECPATKQMPCIQTDKACHKKNHNVRKCMSHAQTEKQRRIHGIDQDNEMFHGTIEMKETKLYQINEKDEVKKKELQTEMEQWTETL